MSDPVAYCRQHAIHHCFCSSLARLLCITTMKRCKYLKRRQVCPHGCRQADGQVLIMCHQYARGRCKNGADNCHYGLHCKPKKATSSQPRGDGFRPHTTDTAMEIELKKHLAELMLSDKCENLLDLDGEMVESLYRRLAVKRHPDKSSNGASGDRFVTLQIAKHHVMEMLPFFL